VSEIGRDQGTSVDVDQIFFNTPARRKFLKGIETEWRHISQTVTGLALANPDIRFLLSHDGREALSVARSSVEDRLEALFRIRIGEGAVLVRSQQGGISVSGYAESPERARKTGSQVIVVNGRWVRHRGIAHAVTDGYGGLLQKDVVPSFALCVTVDPAAVDVNVHPSKREVKFSDPRAVYRAVGDAVRSAVRESASIPEWSKLDSTPILIDAHVGLDDESLATVAYGRPAGGHSVASDVAASLREPLSLDDSQMALPLAIQPAVSSAATDPPESPERAPAQLRFFQLHGRYIMAQVKQGLIIVDQNLAHQRILYEKTVAQMAEQNPETGQALLFPATFDFGLTEIVTVREVMPHLKQMGFGIRDFGGNTVVVDAVPPGLESWSEGELLRQIVDDLISERTAHLDLGDRAIDPIAHFLAIAYARRVAIPYGRQMVEREMENLIDTLFACSEPYTSPSGRPTLSRLSLDEIGRRFNP
jgi:DNA mismatch repair protein MutL